MTVELLFQFQEAAFEGPITLEELTKSGPLGRQVVTAMFDGEQLPCCSYSIFSQLVVNLSNLVLTVHFRKAPWREHLQGRKRQFGLKDLKSAVSQAADVSGSGVNSALKKATAASQALKEQLICKTVRNNSGYIAGCL